MEHLNFHNMKEYCRICLLKLQDKDRQEKNIYNINDQMDLTTLIERFLAIDLSKQPVAYPYIICEMCYNKIKCYENLFAVAQSTQLILNKVAEAKNTNIYDTVKHERLEVFHDAASNDVRDSEILTCQTLIVNDIKNGDSCVFNKSTALETMVMTNSIEINEKSFSDNNLQVREDAEVGGEEEDEGWMNMSLITDVEENSILKYPTQKRKGKSLKCTQCDTKVYKLVYLEAHIRAEHEGRKKPFLCHICQKEFTRYNQLNDHSRNIHPEIYVDADIKNLTCTHCDRRYSSKQALRDHIKRHRQVRQYECLHCGATRVTSTELKIHMRIHNPDIEKFKCDICPQLFKHKSAVKRHVRVVHLGERLYHCEHCDKRFSTKISKNRHEITHDGTKSHECKICFKCFTHEDHLKKHLCHDINSWQYFCKHCKKPCATLRNLKEHERRHLGKKPHICNICSQGFYTAEDLGAHKALSCIK